MVKSFAVKRTKERTRIKARMAEKSESNCKAGYQRGDCAMYAQNGMRCNGQSKESHHEDDLD